MAACAAVAVIGDRAAVALKLLSCIGHQTLHSTVLNIAPVCWQTWNLHDHWLFFATANHA